jgi:hypothetical protein
LLDLVCEPASSQQPPRRPHTCGGGGGPSSHSNATTTTTAAQATRDCGAQEGGLGQTGALLPRRSSPSRQLSIAPSLAFAPVGSCGPPLRSRHQATPTPLPRRRRRRLRDVRVPTGWCSKLDERYRWICGGAQVLPSRKRYGRALDRYGAFRTHYPLTLSKFCDRFL